MSAPEHDLERGPETSSMTMPTISPPANAYPARETMTSPPPMAQYQQRDLSLLHYQAGMTQPENPYLTAFRYHIGIHNDPSLNPHAPQPQTAERITSMLSVGGAVSVLANSLGSSNTTVTQNGVYRPAPNVGIYQRVIAAEQKYHKEYKTWAFLINGALGLQIIFAAALTALGAAGGSHYAVTAFGALNTVLAGLLTFLKGSGLPNRVRYYENSWTKVREYIEQRERDFASDCLRGKISMEEVTAEIAIIESMYEHVRRDIEANTPESYISLTNVARSSAPATQSTTEQQQPQQQQPPPPLKRGVSQMVTARLNDFKDTASHVPQDLEARIRTSISEAEHSFNKGWGDLEKRTTVQVRELSHKLDDTTQSVQKQAESRVTMLGSDLHRTHDSAHAGLHDVHRAAYSGVGLAQQQLGDVQRRLGDAGHDVEARLREMESKMHTVAERAAEKVLDLTRHRHSPSQPHS